MFSASRTLSLSWSVVLLSFIGITNSDAQTITGSVTGTVTDSSGGRVADSTVILTNVETGVIFKARTNGNGVYEMRLLPIGLYREEVQATGFAIARIGPFRLEISQEAKIDAHLGTAAVDQTVLVTAASPLLNTEDSSIGATISATTATESPLPARNFAALTTLAPGAISVYPAGQNNAGRSAANGGAFINGNREQDNNFTLDGQEINEAIDNYIGYSPSVDAIGEVRIITGNATAEYGNANGGEVVMVMKSGTNQFHGNAFEFLQNTDLNANSWANKHTTPISARPRLDRSIFGGTFGGPIVRNKLFFFVDYQGARQHRTTADSRNVPSAAMRSGFDPVNGKTWTILNPAAQYLLAHPEIYPLPNATGSGPYGLVNNYIGTLAQFVRNDQGDAKLDWRINDHDLLAGRFSMGREYEGYSRVSMPTDIPGNQSNPYTGFVTNWTHTFSSNIVNEARAGYGRTHYNTTPADIGGFFGTSGNAKLGIPGAQSLQGFSSLILSGGTLGLSDLGQPKGARSGGWFADSVVNSFTYGDTLNWQHGLHTIKLGGLAVRYQENRFYSGGNGGLGTFTYTGLAARSNNSFTGEGWSDFLQDQASAYGKGYASGGWGQRQWRTAFFAQDDFKLTQDLTVNLGLRWEYDQPLYEVNNKQLNVDIRTGAVSYAGKNGASRALYNSYWGGFMPRVGFAYAPQSFHGRFVLRSGYGITNFMEGTGANLRLTLNPPNFIDSSATSDGIVSYHVANGFPIPANATVLAGSIRAWDPNLRPAFVQQYNVTSEYQLRNDATLTIAYVGQNGNHLVDPREGNQRTCPTCALPLANALPLVTQVSYTESNAVMNYNALQVTGRKRLTNGLEFLANYTWSKSLTNNLGYYGATGVSSQSAYWQDAYNGAADYGPAFFDAAHLFSFSGNYQLPIGRGQQLGGNWNRVTDALLGGWKLGTIVSLHTGFPVTFASTQRYFVNQRANRANQYRKLVIKGRSVNNWYGTDPSAKLCATNVDNGICAYGEQSSTAFGTSRVGTQRAPGYQNIDIAASKLFTLHESNTLQFRADFFNALNLVSLGPPAQNVSASNFGQITTTNSTERQIQLALKYTF